MTYRKACREIAAQLGPQTHPSMTRLSHLRCMPQRAEKGGSGEPRSSRSVVRHAVTVSPNNESAVRHVGLPWLYCRRVKILVVMLVLLAACSQPDGQGTTTIITEPASSSTTIPTETTEKSTIAGQPTTSSSPPLSILSYESIASLRFPVHVTALPGGDVAYVVLKDGRILALVDGGIVDEPVLDISGLVLNRGEQGLFAAALHPDDASRMFVHYSDDSGNTVVSEFTMTSPMAADPESEIRLLEVGQPASNHNGGMIQFAPDGSLMVGLGDGGGANDRFGNGQNTDTLLGGLVRIDVESGDVSLFDYGLRNPWRFWIDGGRIFIADVGQDAYEEVSVAPFEAGLNFGWPITEGLHCFQPASGCSTEGLTLPVIEVQRGDGGSCSVTGGLVYRGAAIPEVNGAYFYSDYCGGYLRSFTYADGAVADQMDWTEQVGVPGRVTGFGHDGAGEIYVATETELLKIVASR